jgi:hypothetical protein
MRLSMFKLIVLDENDWYLYNLTQNYIKMKVDELI